jgi:alkylation response protein AidB-like acyl-CoA dehydrogenase
MRLQPDHDALAFAAAVRDLLAQACDAQALRQAWDTSGFDLRTSGTTNGRVPGLWKRLADMGVTGLVVPEEFDGAGLDLTGAVPVFVEAGRAALPEPLVQTATAATLLAAAGGPLAAEWLPRIAAGDAVAAIGEGSPALVVGGQWADLFLVGDDSGVRALTRDEVRVENAQSIDPGLGLAHVTAPDGAGQVVDGADGLAAFDFACVAVAAELVGLAQAMLGRAVAYAKVREQFGSAIGAFQAVKHQLADAFVANSFALPVVHRAAWSVAHAEPTRLRHASHAKYAAGRAATRAARTALQVHAGIGYTYENDLHMWLKRTWSLTAQWGTTDWHKDRAARALLSSGLPT